jgi:hypothetical protein
LHAAYYGLITVQVPACTSRAAPAKQEQDGAMTAVVVPEKPLQFKIFIAVGIGCTGEKLDLPTVSGYKGSVQNASRYKSPGGRPL